MDERVKGESSAGGGGRPPRGGRGEAAANLMVETHLSYSVNWGKKFTLRCVLYIFFLFLIIFPFFSCPGLSTAQGWSGVRQSFLDTSARRRAQTKHIKARPTQMEYSQECEIYSWIVSLPLKKEIKNSDSE